MDVSWDDWRLFLAVAEAGSLSGAARALRIGQPTLRRRMGLLEEQLDGALFTRRPDGMALTPLAETLLPWPAGWRSGPTMPSGSSLGESAVRRGAFGSRPRRAWRSISWRRWRRSSASAR